MTLLGALDLWASLAVIGSLYCAYIAVYRLWLSPLASIPGPRLAALTSWYECVYDCFLPAKYVFKIKELHKQYGPIIRVNPRVVSVNDVTFLDTIYAPGGGQRRDKDLYGHKQLEVDTSIGGATYHDLHKKRRESLNPFFSHKGALELEPKFNEKISQLSAILTEAARNGSVVNLSDLFFAFASDFVPEYSFGHNRNVLSDQLQANAMRNNLHSLLRSVKFNIHFWWIPKLIKKLPPIIGRYFVPPGVIDMIRFRQTIRKEVDEIMADGNVSKTRNGMSIFVELKNSPTLPPEEKSAQRLVDEATLLVMAGTESPAKSMEIAHFYLLKNPAVMQKVREELRTTPSKTLSQLEKLPYLSAVIAEANRLSFGLTGRNSRVSPDRDTTYIDARTNKAYVLPAGTPMSMSTLLVHTDENYFPEPWKFDPERWLGSAGRERAKYLMAFGKGYRRCAGVHLAHAELCTIIKEVSEWDMKLEGTSEADVKFQHDYQVATPKLDSLGIRARVVGKANH